MPKLEILTGQYTQHQFKIASDALWIGSGEQCEVRLQEPGISRHHARILREGDTQFWVEDAGGSFGTLLNGNHVERARLHPGDELTLGRVKMRFLEEQTDSSLSAALFDVAALDAESVLDDEPSPDGVEQETVIASLASVMALGLEEAGDADVLEVVVAEVELTAGGDASTPTNEAPPVSLWEGKTPLGGTAVSPVQHHVSGEFESLGAEDLLLEDGWVAIDEDEDVEAIELDDDSLEFEEAELFLAPGDLAKGNASGARPDVDDDEEVIELDEDSLIPQETPLDDAFLEEEAASLTEGTVFQPMPAAPRSSQVAPSSVQGTPPASPSKVAWVSSVDVRESTDPGSLLDPLGLDEPTRAGVTAPSTASRPLPVAPPPTTLSPVAPSPVAPSSMFEPAPKPLPVLPTRPAPAAAPLPAALASHTLTRIRKDEIKALVEQKAHLRDDVREVTSATRSRAATLHTEMLQLQEHIKAREGQIAMLNEQLAAQHDERQQAELLASTLAYYREDNQRLEHQLAAYEEAAEENEVLLKKMVQLNGEVIDLSKENRALKSRLLQYRKQLVQHGLLRKRPVESSN